MLIEFITEIGKKENIFGLASSDIENCSDNNFYSYLQKNDQTYTHYINQAPKGSSNMQGIVQFLHGMEKLETIINIKSNFHR